MKKEFLARTNLNLLEERVRLMLETNAANELYNYFSEIEQIKGLNIIITGSGGSYPAAFYSRYVLKCYTNAANISVATPQNAINLIRERHDSLGWDSTKNTIIIGISYSGKTEDMIAVYKKNCKQYGMKFLLITAANPSSLTRIYKQDDSTKIISYYNKNDTTGYENSFVSLFATLAPCILFRSLLSCVMDNTEIDFNHFIYKMISNAEEEVKSFPVNILSGFIKEHPVIHLFYEWDTYATALDIESKFTESGIASVVLHEKKNFSHGRTTLLYTNDFGVAINLVNYEDTPISDYSDTFRTEYDELLTNFLKELCKKRNASYLEIFDKKFSCADDWNLATLFTFTYLIVSIGEELEIDIGAPITPYPKETLPLYNYKGNF